MTATSAHAAGSPGSPGSASQPGADAARGRRIELILRQIDALPTLPAVATRLLSMTANDDAHAREVVELVSSDIAITSKILALCRKADMGVRDDVLTIDRAVVLLGFNAIRNAVLSLKVFETLGASRNDRPADEPPVGEDAVVFDRVGFWRHSLAVAILAERIAADHPGRPDLPAGEAFVCGLLHDVGKLAIDHVLPRSYARVVELTDFNQGNIAEFERRIVGLDHHTAGKRLAERWRLPQRLQDAIWLHGSPYHTLPRLEHRTLIGLIGLADLLVRRQHLGYSGNFLFKQNVAELVNALTLDPRVVDQATGALHRELERRSGALGLDDTPSDGLFMSSIQAANQALGRLNDALDRRGRTAARQAQVLEAVTAFHAGAAPGQGVQDQLNAVIASAWNVLGGGFYGMLYQPAVLPDEARQWLICQFGQGGRPMRSELIEPPPAAPDLTSLDPQEPMGMSLAGIVPWIADYLMDSPDVRRIRMLPLGCGWGTAAVLLHDREALPAWPLLATLSSTWGAAIAAAGQHEGARRLGEELAASNLALAEAQDRLLHQESMARLGEMAAGAAHEMNNPLAVISGRSQLLAMNLPAGGKEQQAARTIFEQSHRLSDLITALRRFADPPRAQRIQTDVATLLRETVDSLQAEMAGANVDAPITVKLPRRLPHVDLDPEQIAECVTELLRNAVQAQPKTGVRLSAVFDEQGDELWIQVADDGEGMDAHTLAHALDPFFSAKAAGRRIGMGLTRTQQLAAGHGGRVDLRSTPGQGATATLMIPLHSSS